MRGFSGGYCMGRPPEFLGGDMRIKYSKRGLTFSFQANETFEAGTKYRYIVDTKDASIIIIPDQNGKYKMSQKGDNRKPLVDLRNKEVKEAISLAQYMEIEITNETIIVHVIKKTMNVEGLSDKQTVELFDKTEKQTLYLDKKDFIEHNTELISALTAAGIFSSKEKEDISYVFDVVSLFSGAGMLDFPFKLDDSFDIKFAVDFDKSACETYRHMIGDHILCMDMRDLDVNQVPECDVLIGGPCCQGYSNANRALTGKEEARKKRLLIHDYIRVVKERKPLVFLVENVPQFLTKDNAEHLNTILTELSDYEVTYSVVNDNDVGGYSNRKRMILIGSRIGKIEIPDVELFKKRTCGDALKKVDSTWIHYGDLTMASDDTKRKMAFVHDGQNYKAIPEMAQLDRHSCTYKRLDADKPSIALPNWRKVNIMPPEKFLSQDATGKPIQRQLNCAEAKAIQGMPKDYRFFGSLNDIQQQIGNGVTRAIATFAKCMIKNALIGYANTLCPSI